MKCKKLFAMLLSLCMIASAFVAVSAEEAYKVETTKETVSSYTTPVEATGDLVMGVGLTAKAVADPLGQRSGNVLELTLSDAANKDCSKSNNNVVAVPLKDAGGNNITTIKTGDTISYSMYIYMPGEGDLNLNSTEPNLLLRPRAAAMTSLWSAGPDKSPIGYLASGKKITKGDWCPLEGEWVADKDYTYSGVWYVYFRPNTTTAGDKYYIDDVSVKVERALANPTSVWVSADEVATPVTKTATISGNTVSVNINNTSGMMYKLSGTLFIAEYNGDQLVQFASSAPLALEEYEAGEEVTVTASFANTPVGTVKAFLWDTATLAPHYFVPNVQ